MFLDYGGDGEEREYSPRSAKKPGFDVTPSFVSAFGPGVPQAKLHPLIRNSVEAMQSQPGYKAWRASLEKPPQV